MRCFGRRSARCKSNNARSLSLVATMTETSEPPGKSEDQNDAEGWIVLTRGRWTLYFLAALALTTILGVTLFLTTGEESFLCCPLSAFAVWIVWPPPSVRARRISASPGVPQLLAWLAFMILEVTGIAVFDVLVIGHGWMEPSKPYHLWLLIPLGVILILGVYFIDKRYQMSRQPSDKAGDSSSAADGSRADSSNG